MAQVNTFFTDGARITDGTATSTAFTLLGGKYAHIVNATGAGSVIVQILSTDGTTYVNVSAGITATTGFAVLDLPAGTYKIAIATFTAVYTSLVPIPIRTTN